ncbi:glutathione S-transferase C-terminal domain-containing protein [Pseudooctadecabacter sp.]|uniref:glutathione S-transferase C-terminal domain-containing protein n=1 Tax=Pseudooctadecabacter sp. TaxID=1966338 RepID=UPI0035C7AD6B
MTKAVEEDQTNIDTRRAQGEFVRGQSGFRHWIGTDAFPAQAGRYHLYVALNCPWCHRVTLARSILGLTRAVTMDVAFPNREDNLWTFDPTLIASLTDTSLPECTPETATGQGHRHAKTLYEAEGSDEKSLPILYDKTAQRIVTNESAEIVRMFGAHSAELGGTGIDIYPETLRDDIDALNDVIYVAINNGAYKAGFSSDQTVYAKAFGAYFDALTDLDARLSDGRPFLTGDTFTEADLRLFPTLYRHDPVYYVRMKLNGARMLDYPYLWRWLCRVYALPGVADAGSLLHCRQGYFGNSWNKTVPLGPRLPMPYPQAYRHPELADR